MISDDHRIHDCRALVTQVHLEERAEPSGGLAVDEV